jgi:hypothetical protein
MTRYNIAVGVLLTPATDVDNSIEANQVAIDGG